MVAIEDAVFSRYNLRFIFCALRKHIFQLLSVRWVYRRCLWLTYAVGLMFVENGLYCGVLAKKMFMLSGRGLITLNDANKRA
jgi:hypothetical protein